MKQFNDFKAEKAVSNFHLPAGAYAARIIDARELTYDWGSVIAIGFDITEGEYKDFFRNDLNNQTREDKKWKGTYRLNVPKDDGSEKDGWTKRTFGNVIWALEDGNPGYHFDWDEKKFVGKNICVVFRNKEWEYEGKTGWTTECGAITSINDFRNGSVKPLKDKPLANKSTASADSFGAIQFETVSSSEELPF